MTVSASPQPIGLLPIVNPRDQLRPLSLDRQKVAGPPAFAVHAFASSTPARPTATPGSLKDAPRGSERSCQSPPLPPVAAAGSMAAAAIRKATRSAKRTTRPRGRRGIELLIE